MASSISSFLTDKGGRNRITCFPALTRSKPLSIHFFIISSVSNSNSTPINNPKPLISLMKLNSFFRSFNFKKWH